MSFAKVTRAYEACLTQSLFSEWLVERRWRGGAAARRAGAGDASGELWGGRCDPGGGDQAAEAARAVEV